MFGPTHNGGERREIILQICLVLLTVHKQIHTHRSKHSRRLGSVSILFWDPNFNFKKANTLLLFFTFISGLNSVFPAQVKKPSWEEGKKNPNATKHPMQHKPPAQKHKKTPAQTAVAFTFSKGFYALGQNKGYVTHCQIARRLKESALLRTCIMMAPRTHKEFVPHVRIRVC